MEELNRLGFSVFPSHSNFVNIRVDPKIRDPLVSYLKGKAILIKAGADHVALRFCIRITAGPKHKMEPVIHAIESFIKEAKKNR